MLAADHLQLVTRRPEDPLSKTFIYLSIIQNLLFNMLHSFIDGRLAVDWNLPYELRAFETALAEGVRVLDSQVDCLEEAAFPTLEALATKVIITCCN